MIFLETKLAGVFEVHIEPNLDERGMFARTWCQKEFETHDLNPRVVQCNTSFNIHQGTLRGLHFQAAPNTEAKLVRCTRGSIYDVILDLRPNSRTFKQWFALTLTADNRNAIFIPEGCAHGFLTLEDNTEIFYQMSEFFVPGSARGVRWDDPAFNIAWPEKVKIISDRDRTYPDFE